MSATCVRVPVENAHREAVWVTDPRGARPGRAREVLGAAPGVMVLDDPSRDPYPTALGPTAATTCSSAGSGATSGATRSLALWIVGDNLRKGAATNAVQIAELCIREGLLGRRAAA